MEQSQPQTQVVDYAALLAQQAEEIAKRVAAPTGDMIKVNQNKTFTFPDKTVTADPFRAVVVDFISTNYFYPAAYNPNDITPPDCFSLGEEPALLVPSVNSPKRQAETCAVCPQNQWGSGSGNGKACRNHRLLALLPAPGDDFDPTAWDDKPLQILRLSPTAIKFFDEYVIKVSRMFRRPPVGVVSLIGLDPARQYPVVRFGAPEPLSDSVLGYFAGRMEEARKRLMTEPTIVVAEEKELPQPVGKTKTRR